MLDAYDEVIVLLSKGAYFGEVPALLNLRRMAKIMAVTWCELLRLDHVSRGPHDATRWQAAGRPRR